MDSVEATAEMKAARRRHGCGSTVDFSISCTHVGDDVVLALAGEVDPLSVLVLADRLDEAIFSGASVVVVDAADLEFLGSGGTDALAEASHVARLHHVDLVVRRSPAGVAAALRRSGLDALLDGTRRAS